MRPLFSLLLTSIWVVSAVARLPGPVVSTQQGDVQGTLVTPSVRQFLGIPYAAADRWTAPQLPAKRNGLFIGDRFGDSCIQQFDSLNSEFLRLSGFPNPNVTESEDCLSVNIWAPSVSRKQNAAVMIWVYGGGFSFGTSNFPTYDGQFIVRDNDDIIVVTFNYRMNIFGQPNAPQLTNSTTSSQNFGLLDIDAAVNWVHDNIASFGGDPNRIILFGQSAGGAAIDAYTFAHADDTIVKGAIQQSGSISGGDSQPFPDIDPTSWNNVSDAVGCGATPNDAQLECMKNVPGRTLENALISTGVTLSPIIDGITAFNNTSERATAGKFLKVPLLIGSTQNEADILVLGELLQSPLGFAPPLVAELAADLMTELSFTCPASVAAQNRLNAGVPTWRYQYQAVFRDISTRPELRAYHTSELPIVFGTYNRNSKTPDTPEEVALSKYIQSAWVAFARDPQRGLSNFGWPIYNPTSQSLVQLGNFYNRSSATFGKASEIDFTCSKADALAALATQVNNLLEP